MKHLLRLSDQETNRKKSQTLAKSDETHTKKTTNQTSKQRLYMKAQEYCKITINICNKEI